MGYSLQTSDTTSQTAAAKNAGLGGSGYRGTVINNAFPGSTLSTTASQGLDMKWVVIGLAALAAIYLLKRK